MTAQFPPPQRRRMLALCVAIVLLHGVVLGWVDSQIRAQGATVDEPAELVFVSELPAPARPAVAKPAQPERSRPRPRVRRPAPLAHVAIVAAIEPPAAIVEGAASAPADVESASATVIAAAPEPLVAVEPAPPVPLPAASEARRYKVDLPPSAEIAFDVTRTDANGSNWSGEAALVWKLKDGAYSVAMEAGIRVLFAHINLVRVTSVGAIGEDGFVPQILTEKRRGRALTETRFSQQQRRITFSASERDYALLPGTQDKATLPLQLAAIARGDPGQLSGDIDIFVGEDRDASVFHFVVLGQEDIDTRLGRMQAWHLSRPPRPGVYGSRLDIWLAPSRNWYPVQIRNTEANGAVTTQKVSNIVITEAGT